MVASGEPWQLVTTFNEWGEGTSVESAVEWASASGYGQYMDVLHNNGNGAPLPPLRPPSDQHAGSFSDTDEDGTVPPGASPTSHPDRHTAPSPTPTRDSDRPTWSEPYTNPDAYHRNLEMIRSFSSRVIWFLSGYSSVRHNRW